MPDLLVAALPAGLFVVWCLLPGLGTVRALLDSEPRRALPLLRDRWQALEQGATAVLALALLAIMAPWHLVPVALWGLAAAATAFVAVGGVLAAPSLPRLAADRRGRLRPRTRALSALVAVALAALVVLAQV
ncbi:hypothetical protein [uncultured Pseudokineococcus sp.]|uniref:hypothetical protein n=1 Tax=uncultured Pseudokineococcus sp. TaxID=1642928 RepID=UPI002601AB28|nr:hypothetical protein [uncultured Pseudokineococcus sp.]